MHEVNPDVSQINTIFGDNQLLCVLSSGVSFPNISITRKMFLDGQIDLEIPIFETPE